MPKCGGGKKKVWKMFGGYKKKQYLCTRKLQNALKKDGSLAQLNRAFDYGSKGCRFESCRSHKDGDATTYNEWLHFLIKKLD